MADSDPVMLTEASARKVAQVVRRYWFEPRPEGRSHARVPASGFWAEITEVDTTDGTRFKAKEVYKSDAGAEEAWLEHPDGRRADGSDNGIWLYAQEEGATFEAGAKVWAVEVTIPDPGNPTATLVEWWTQSAHAGPLWCKVTSLNACGRSFNANPCAVGGVDVDTETELVVYTTTPTDPQAPVHLGLSVGDVVAYQTAAGDVHFQVNPRQLVSFGYQCNTNRSSVGGTDYLADDFLLSTGNYGACAGVNVGKVELSGTRFSTYGAAFDTRGKRVVFGGAAPPTAAADTNTAHLVRWTLAGSTMAVSDGQCGEISVPGVTVDAYVPATMIEGYEPSCATNGGKVLRLKFSERFKITPGADGLWEIDVRTEEKDLAVADIDCVDGSITYTSARVNVVIPCTSGGA